ncbi:hypothetical protein DH2020_017641 [Rehmannia glutinosa]|uniref:Uncharacterized protein n=1 Tax=Rehmannia glutinosa TaxID=99300 RepID=A0ABR0WT30_REHGL
MSWIGANSSPAPTTSKQQYDDSALEGVAAHIKLLLKVIQDHKDACKNEKNDRRRLLRVATIITILDTIKTRIQKCQSFGNKISQAEMVVNEKEMLRRQLSASLAARKSLEIMCSSLGKEKEIMSLELSRKVQELSGMEEFINDIKAQNETLVERLQECALKHKDMKCVSSLAFQERNNVLSEQLLRSLDGYQLMKRKLKEAQEDNMMMCGNMDEMGAKIVMCLEKVRRFKERMLLSSDSDREVDVQEEILSLENMFECFEMLVVKTDQKQGECYTKE